MASLKVILVKGIGNVSMLNWILWLVCFRLNKIYCRNWIDCRYFGYLSVIYAPKATFKVSRYYTTFKIAFNSWPKTFQNLFASRQFEFKLELARNQQYKQTTKWFEHMLYMYHVCNWLCRFVLLVAYPGLNFFWRW